MSKAGSAAKVKLNSFDDLFGASDMTAGTDQVQEIPLSELYEFKGHPFKVLDDEKMQETAALCQWRKRLKVLHNALSLAITLFR